jgi:hypothetical protein
MRDFVVRYVRHPNTTRAIGCVVAVRTNDGIKFGFSQCNPKDQFNRKKGREIAIQRALIGSNVTPAGITVTFWFPSCDSFRPPKCKVMRNIDAFSEVYERVGQLAGRAFCERSETTETA